ncbi:MAG: colanic acid biosynthesis acetyltransferase WcaF [Helicobacteraceae bacterium]|nr:colanic acid biosynthesis acetyltransferase WcaF [Helicobacteraceae bacterium]
MKKVKLSKYESYYEQASKIKLILWYLTNMFLFKTMLPLPSMLKAKVLRFFGASVGVNVVIKPNVNIKHPWLLSVGDHTWIGEGVWIDNLALVNIGSNVCLSQGCYLLTGSHDYTKEGFELLLGEITLADGVWIGAKAVVCPSVVCESHSVLTAGSIATKSLSSYSVYQGNPATFKRKRELK